MRIEVVVDGWEQACCGVPIRLGETASFNLVALDPTAQLLPPPTPDVPRFTVDNHGQTPADVPQRRLAGLVAGITGVSYPSVPVAGMGGTRTADTTRPQLRALDSVGAGDDAELNEYRVLLELPDGTVLPHFAVSAEHRAQREQAEHTAALVERRGLDEVGVALRALADDAHNRFGGLASTVRSETTSAVSILPTCTDGAAVHWQRSADDHSDGIRVQLGGGTWMLPATPAGVAVLHEFLDAAAAGRVEELVDRGDERSGARPGALLTRVSAADGRSWTATTPLSSFGNGPVMAVSRQLWRRLERGDIRYVAWA